MRTQLLFLCSVIAIAATAPALAQDSSLRVEREGRAPVTLSSDAIRRLPSDTLSLASHGATPVRYRAVRLTDIMAAASSPVDSLRLGRRGWIIAAVARDGYVAVFSAGEIEPTVGPTRVWVAFERDGAALTAEEAPFHVIVPSDARGTRSARQVTTLRILDALPAAPR
ncbi:MAG: molybdopterin-binding protein [Gemmatimonadaceae bacterium]